MTTTLIANGTILDGTGGPGFTGHLLIDGDRIADVVPSSGEHPQADRVVDVAGRAVAPGFIDMHSHADWVLPTERHPELLGCFLEQGVTTVVAGNCGISPAPARPDTTRHLEGVAAVCIADPLDFRWSSMADFLAHLDATGPLLNVAQLVGHAAIRNEAAETRRGPMTPEELGRCLGAARRALDEGACGLSFGLGYDPGMYSSLDELAAFCAVASAADKPVTVHLKALSRVSPCYPITYLGAHNVRALKEMLAVAEQTGARLQLSHFIFVGRRSWRTAPECLRLVAEARERGLDVMIDAFPYTCGNTTINAILPYWFLRQLPEAYDSRAARARLRLELEIGFRLVGFGLSDLQVMDVGIEGKEALAGRRIDEIAEDWGRSPLDVLLTLSRESRGAATMLLHTYSGDDDDERALESVLKDDFCLFETDAVVRHEGYPNPAALGTFPRILGEYSRERGLFALEEAVRRMTSASATRFGLTDRGVLEKGKAADVVVFAPDTVSDGPPHGTEPARPPTGIEHVFLNGQEVVRAGRCLDVPPAGRVLTT